MLSCDPSYHSHSLTHSLTHSLRYHTHSITHSLTLTPYSATNINSDSYRQLFIAFSHYQKTIHHLTHAYLQRKSAASAPKAPSGNPGVAKVVSLSAKKPAAATTPTPAATATTTTAAAKVEEKKAEAPKEVKKVCVLWWWL